MNMKQSDLFADENEVKNVNYAIKLPDDSSTTFRKVTFDPNIETFCYKPCPKQTSTLGPPVRNEAALNTSSMKLLSQKSPSARELIRNRSIMEPLATDPRKTLAETFEQDDLVSFTNVSDKEISVRPAISSFQRIPVQAPHHATDSKPAVRLPISNVMPITSQTGSKYESSTFQRVPASDNLLNRVQQMAQRRPALSSALSQPPVIQRIPVESIPKQTQLPQQQSKPTISLPQSKTNSTQQDSSINGLHGSLNVLEKQQAEMKRIMENLKCGTVNIESFIPITTPLPHLPEADVDCDVKLELCTKVSKLEQIIAEREEEIRDMTLSNYSKSTNLQQEISRQSEEIRDLKKNIGDLNDEKSKQAAEVRRISRSLVQYERKQPQASNSDEFWQKSIASMREVGRLEQDVSDLKVKLERSQSNLEEGKRRELELVDTVSRLQNEALKTMEIVSTLKRECDTNREFVMKFEVVKREQIAANVQLISLRNEIDCLRQSHRQEIASVAREKDLQLSKLREQALKSCRQSIAEEQANNQVVIAAHAPLTSSEGINESDTSEVRSRRCDNDLESRQLLLDSIADKEAIIVQLEEQVRSAESLRRDLHDKIQELRGNIRVYVRCRPFISEDGQNEVQSAVKMNKHTDTVSLLDYRQNQRLLGDKSSSVSLWNDFVFDRVFDENCAQSEVFCEVKDFVRSAMDGHRVSLFSYGQTGSGKTHTMIGSGKYEMKGIIPRSIDLMLEEAVRLKSQGWNFQLTASFLEIYNEQINDLLQNYSGPGIVESFEESDSKVGQKRKNNDLGELLIKIHPSGSGVHVPGLIEVTLPMTSCYEQIEGGQMDSVVDLLLKTAEGARSVAQTDMNDQSSRSHSVFSLNIVGTNADSKTRISGMLNLVDLAGSERVCRSGAINDAQRLKEASNINKSLSCLADIFTALKNKASHIPFRNSKLTYLLQDCFTGCGKTLMFINLSPTVLSAPETASSLNFAKLISQIELGHAVRNVSQGGFREGDSEASLSDFKSQDSAVQRKPPASSQPVLRSQTSRQPSAKLLTSQPNDAGQRKRSRN